MGDENVFCQRGSRSVLHAEDNRLGQGDSDVAGWRVAGISSGLEDVASDKVEHRHQFRCLCDGVKIRKEDVEHGYTEVPYKSADSFKDGQPK